MIQVTMTFSTAEEVAAFFAGKPVKAALVSAPAQAAAASKPTAEAAPAPAAAPTPKAEPSLTFEGLVDKLKAYSKKASRDDFAALMKKHGVAKVPELKDKPDTWAEIAATCDA